MIRTEYFPARLLSDEGGRQEWQIPGGSSAVTLSGDDRIPNVKPGDMGRLFISVEVARNSTLRISTSWIAHERWADRK